MQSPSYDVIAYGSVDLPPDEDLPTVAKEFVIEAINVAEMGEVGGRDIFGNSLGRRLLEEAERLDSKYHARHKAKMPTEVIGTIKRLEADI
jgi:hypothetical protein